MRKLTHDPETSSVSLPSWVYEDIMKVLTAVAELPDRWLEPCAFAITGACTDHILPSCPRQMSLHLLGELAHLEELSHELEVHERRAG